MARTKSRTKAHQNTWTVEQEQMHIEQIHEELDQRLEDNHECENTKSSTSYDRDNHRCDGGKGE